MDRYPEQPSKQDLERLGTLFHKLHPQGEEALLIERMRTKLAENSGKKRSFLGCDLQFLSMRITQEKAELVKAVQEGKPINDVWREAADVANFAAMIAVNYELQHASVNSTEPEGGK